ncbi:MAG: efflux RND transporter periplasmic adaptor subunit [Myxococcota bacterium]
MFFPTKSPILYLPLAMALLVGCTEESSAPASSESVAPDPAALRATRVEIARVLPTAASLSTRWPGEVVGSEDALLASAMGGFIERVLVEEGEDVQRNQTLVRVDTASASAQAGMARVELDAAQRELERAERLGDAITEQQLDAARNRVAAARAALRVANVASSRSVIRAPFAGTVAALDVERGEVAAPGVPLVRLVKLSPVHISLSVPDRDVASLRPGMEVRVQADANGGVGTGVVERVSPAADLRTRAFEVRVEVANEGRQLLPGMIAEVEVSGASIEGAVVVPQYTLVTALEENGVFVEVDGKAVWRPVRVGRVVRDQVLIEDGLAVGERLIVTGHRELQEGDDVLVMREGACCTDGRVRFAEGPDATAPEPEPEAAPVEVAP